MNDYLSKMFDLTGKVAVVTGGSRGLGYEMVKGFAAAGADVVIASRKLEACENVAREIEAMGRRALPLALHVARWNELDGFVEAVYAHFGKIDVLVNNAGLSPLAPSSVEVTEKLFDTIVGVNFKGPFRLATHIGSRMAAGAGGCIINISSGGALRPKPRFAVYSGAKAALNTITEALAFEYGPKVRVNCISAGPFTTDIARDWTPEQKDRSHHALKRMGNPHEIVSTAIYLASDSASYTTGTLVRVDGGQP
ncbi:MAG: SDR family NAD(P)-dependent oxidoreductase [Gammaproteobacteria bacterium]